MVWTIPNTFVAGTKARANEVNDNFTSLKQFVDGLEVQASTNEINITNLENNKADLNGNNQQRFQVANPTASFDAVNLQTLQAKTLNSRSTIDGFQLSKFNNTTITATAGNCYDSTFEYMISQATSLQVSNSSLGENATYYVYVCAEASTSTNQLVLDTSSTTPNLPPDYDYFRRIGTVITDDNGHIDTVTSIGNNYSGALNSTGWVKLPNGLQLVWGTTGNVGASSSSNVTFTRDFDSACFAVMVTPISYGGRGGQNGDKMGQQAMVTSKNTTQFTIRNFGEQVYVNYAYLAIGV